MQPIGDDHHAHVTQTILHVMTSPALHGRAILFVFSIFLQLLIAKVLQALNRSEVHLEDNM